MKVHKISYGGLEVFADAYALDGDQVMFMSMFGNKTAVKGVWSSFLSNRWVDLFADVERVVSLDRDNKWRVYAKVLPSGIAHAMLIPQQLCFKRLRQDFLMIGYSEQDIRQRFFLYLNKASKIPLKKEWSDWVFTKAKTDAVLVKLTSFNIVAFYYHGDDDWLCELITSGIKQESLV